MSRIVVLATAMCIACGGSGKPPVRAVIESDVGSWKFRRYQKVLDIEVWVAKNRAEAHTASYARIEAEKRGSLGEDDVVNAFVTRYQKDEAIVPALVRFVRRLARDSGYEVEERRIADVRVISVKGGGEFWMLWAAKRHIVKLGGRGRESVPESLLEAYGERYPSKLRSGVLDGPVEEASEDEPETESFDPKNPKPDWQE